MLTIPGSVNSLFNRDGVRKNFRVHFPNGEFSDLTNADVVQESMKFTESLCSQNVFRFGLAEASVLEFECVGVGNMYGMTIEAGIEIDTSSLSAAQISAIQANPGDGSLVLAADSDLGFGYYRVPLGAFCVESCPRDNQAKAHRRVVAYSVDLIGDVVSPFEDTKMRQRRTTDAMTYYSVDSLIYANLGWLNPQLVTDKFTKTTVTGQYQHNVAGQVSYTIDGYTLTISWQYDRTSYSIAAAQNADTFWRAEKHGFDNSSAISWLKSTLESINLGEYYDKAYSSYLKNVLNFVGGGRVTSEDVPICLAAPGTSPTLYCPTYVTLQIVWTKTQSVFSNTFTLYQTNTYLVSTLAFSSTPSSVGITLKPTGKNGIYYSYVGAYSMKTLLPGWLELGGLFGSGHRGLGLKIFPLPSVNTYVLMNPDAYSECWWDEYDVLPIGIVTATFTNGTDGESTFDITIGDGPSIYDMRDNALLKSATITLADLTTLLSGDFATNAEKVAFTPMEATRRAWPFLEAGDAIAVFDENYNLVFSYALRIEMSGIQDLKMHIVSEGGEIIREA